MMRACRPALHRLGRAAQVGGPRGPIGGSTLSRPPKLSASERLATRALHSLASLTGGGGGESGGSEGVGEEGSEGMAGGDSEASGLVSASEGTGEGAASQNALQAAVALDEMPPSPPGGLNAPTAQRDAPGAVSLLCSEVW